MLIIWYSSQITSTQTFIVVNLEASRFLESFGQGGSVFQVKVNIVKNMVVIATYHQNAPTYIKSNGSFKLYEMFKEWFTIAIL